MTFDINALGMSFTSGLVIGVFYFLGLWWTVRRLSTVRAPALWTIASFVVRSGIVLAGFYLVMAGRWDNLLACLAGFTLIRLWLIRRLSPASVKIRPGCLRKTSRNKLDESVVLLISQSTKQLIN
ncbi:MAG: ATP synthase subunit I [Desulfobacterales bacterium]|jgi:F1F0 ATPase subunit 2